MDYDENDMVDMPENKGQPTQRPVEKIIVEREKA